MASQRRTDGERLRETVGRNLRLAQAQAGLKNRAVADAVGLDVGLLVKHKGGRSMPGPDYLAKYAELFERPVAWFFEERQDEWEQAA